MRTIKVIDTTLCSSDGVFSFKEKLEIARVLHKINVDSIELPEIANESADILLVKTISSFVGDTEIAVKATSGENAVNLAITALEAANNPKVTIELPVSVVGMEYLLHKKEDKMLKVLENMIKKVKAKGIKAEFCALDATRAEEEFLIKAINCAIENGVDELTISDDAEILTPDDFALFINNIKEKCNINFAVSLNNTNGLGIGNALQAVKCGAVGVKTTCHGDIVPLKNLVEILVKIGNNYGIKTNINNTKISKAVNQINWFTKNEEKEKSVTKVSVAENFEFTAGSGKEELISAIEKLGYDISSDDLDKVYNEAMRYAEKKPVTTKEIDAIIAAVALAVPATYKLESYVVNNGNIITSSAQITLTKNGEVLKGVSIGDGPVDAAFLAIESIIGHHYELDDFQIQAVTEGKEAMGSALVKIRVDGKLYSGNGISTDIIGASINAYINALNKIAFEEGN